MTNAAQPVSPGTSFSRVIPFLLFQLLCNRARGLHLDFFFFFSFLSVYLFGDPEHCGASPENPLAGCRITHRYIEIDEKQKARPGTFFPVGSRIR